MYYSVKPKQRCIVMSYCVYVMISLNRSALSSVFVCLRVSVSVSTLDSVCVRGGNVLEKRTSKDKMRGGGGARDVRQKITRSEREEN